jgi:DNA-binding CsgD family transcriptional regulator/DNA-binding FrmR family transcriptional regulator
MIRNYLIGRIREKSELFREIDNVKTGRGCTIFISGESGVGKTRLVEEVIEMSGMDVFSIRSNDEGSPSYYLFKVILKGLAEKYDYLISNKDSDMHNSAFLLDDSVEIPSDMDFNDIRSSIIKLLEKYSSERPFILFLDDIQWADNASLDLLQKLAEDLGSHSIALIAVYRSDEIDSDHKIRKIRNNLRRFRKFKEIELRSFDYNETKDQIETILGYPVEDSAAERIYYHTQGLPLFTEEIIHTLLDEKILVMEENIYKLTSQEIPVPENVKDTILLRLNNISVHARNFIESASVLGIEFQIEAAEILSGSDRGVDELIDNKMLYEAGPGKLSFRHILIKEAIKSSLSWSRKKNLHRQAALFYEENNYAPENITEHWLLSNEPDKARETLIKSIEMSCKLHAFDDAAEKANLALQIWPEHKDEANRVKILFRYAHCSQINGKPDEALKAIKEISLSSHFGEDNNFAAEVFKLQGTVYGLKGMWEQAVECRKKAAEEFMDAGLYAEAALEYLISAGRNSAMQKYDRALESADSAVRMADEAKRPDLKARALGLYGNILAMQGKYTAGTDVVRKALTIALRSRDAEAASEVYRRLASTLEYASDYPAARDAYFSAYDYCMSTGENVNAQVCLGCMSYILFQTGDLKSSTEVCKKVIQSPDSPEGSKAVAYGITGLISLFRGEMKHAEKNLSIALQLSEKYKITSLEFGVLWGFAIYDTYRNDIVSAASRYNYIIDKWYDTQDHHDIIQVMMWAAEFFGENYMVKENAHCTEILAKIASATGNPEAMAALAFAMAESSCLHKNYAEAEKQYHQALEHLDKLNIPLEQVQTQYKLGCCLIALGKSEAAAIYLNRAYRTARNLGMRPLSSQIASKMENLDIQAEERRNPDSKERASAAGLTKRQKEILLFLSEGLTNKEISDKIFLSTRTVDMHVRNILQRFNCRTRTEAVSKAKEMQIL